MRAGHILLAFDPGHTTGWALFRDYELIESGEVDTSDIETAVDQLMPLFQEYSPDNIVLEDYRIYRWKQKHHVGSELTTTRVIGCIETLSTIHGISLFKQPAQVAKTFCKDTKLKAWGVYKQGERHARDAIRHGIYFLINGPLRKHDKAKRSAG